MAINQRRAAMNDSVERSVTISIWIAFVAKQTKRDMYPLTTTGFLIRPSLIENGPAKSTPVTVNGDESVTLASGSCPICWCKAFVW